MPSIRARLVSWNLKRTVKSRPLHLIEPEVLRSNFDEMAPDAIPDGVTLREIDNGTVKGEWHCAEKPAVGLTILYLHGGGYIFGSSKSYRALTFALAEECQAEIFSLNYRLAPEHPFPAAVEDAVAAYQWLLEEGRDPARIFIMGDSAGGGLAVSLLVSLVEREIPLPSGGVVFSPFTDMSVSGKSMDENEKSDALFKKIYVSEGARKYLADADPQSPLASPIFADLKGLPPLLIYASDSEVLLDDAVRLHDRLLAAGVQSKLVVEKGLAHIWPLFVGKMPEALRTIREAAGFIRQRYKLTRVK